MERKWGNREKMMRAWENGEKISISCPFPISFQFSPLLSICSPFSHSLTIFSEAASQLPSTCASLIMGISWVYHGYIMYTWYMPTEKLRVLVKYKNIITRAGGGADLASSSPSQSFCSHWSAASTKLKEVSFEAKIYANKMCKSRSTNTTPANAASKSIEEWRKEKARVAARERRSNEGDCFQVGDI